MPTENIGLTSEDVRLSSKNDVCLGARDMESVGRIF